uniref:Uncharacterized protein n=1 Tax=Branchiostoma floridae TaxID=7739 RepID=C3ZXM2_BRAFL|eukprot:XP_002586674.1 hypothetical protein BRAFLDRAFT_105480 [Branchiostoma floridae]
MTYGTLFGMKYAKICSRKCHFVQHYGYYTIDGNKFYDDDWADIEYLLSSCNTAVQIKMLQDFDVELLIGILSYDQKADIYNYVHKYNQSGKNIRGKERGARKEDNDNSGFAVEKDGDLTVKDDDGERGIKCNTQKDKSGVRLNAISAGVLAFIKPCNIILGLHELYLAESKSQVYGHLHSLLSRSEMGKTEYIIYDDACHLRKFARNPARADATETTRRLANMEMLVDRMHMRGHVDPWCKKHCGTWRFEDLDLVNTEVCEQVFSWLSRFNRMTKHMNQHRFMFFLLYISHLHNVREELKLSSAGLLVFMRKNGTLEELNPVQIAEVVVERYKMTEEKRLIK